MSLSSKEQIVSWLRSMKVTWRVAHTRPTRGHRILFKADYRCQFNSPPREKLQTNRSSINTNCPAKLRVTLVRTEGSRGQRSRNTDPHIPAYPTLVDISNIHNHNTHVPGTEVTTATAHAPQVLDRTVLNSTLREFSAVAQSSAGFRRASAAMMQSFHRLKGNPAALQAAMHTFGRHGTDHPTSLPGRSSVSRPEVELGGRRQLGGGRRKKMVPTPDAEAAMSGCDSS
ncbi:Hypothetical protein SMAX5B_021570 [Scophthalmus maximus]|uniref:Uncharacterized protein n=2 Tax=Scophthalmus maximus TaxID=52904 RepID=A0A2U9BLZ0_SCOMX|nr:Hypothetical protein SMAX5B_021570 [Scophthalmus maximus]